MSDDNGEPLVKLDPAGVAPILSYNVPQPTSYSGRNFIELELDNTDSPFSRQAHLTPPSRTPVKDLDLTTLRSAVETGMRTAFADKALFPNIQTMTNTLRFAELPEQATPEDPTGKAATAPRPRPRTVPDTALAANRALLQFDALEAAAALQQGKRLNVYTSMYGTVRYHYIPEKVKARPRLFLVETYKLSTFLGSYGAGQIVKTFTLLPGEKTRINVKTFTKTEQERKEASSILDSFTEESADEFETSLQEETSNKESYQETFEYHAEAEAKASWGWGSAKVSGGVKGGTNAAREEFGKNVSSSVSKQASKASAKRDVQINTSYEVKEETGEEISIEREIENINLSRTLNFVFRQMNQEFVSLLHLVDVRIGFFNGFAESRREVTLPELDSLLDDVVQEHARPKVRSHIMNALAAIFDYRGDVHRNFVETRDIDGEKYQRVNPELFSTYDDQVTGTKITVPGIIVTATKNTMRTEGVIVETLLGQGEALDDYATQLQISEVAKREAEVALQQALAERAELLNQVVTDGDTEKAKLLADLTCPCGSDEDNDQAEP